jgi:hypothetical protein
LIGIPQQALSQTLDQRTLSQQAGPIKSYIPSACMQLVRR